MKNKGFTLVELLAIIAVLGIMAMMVFPNIGESISSKKEKELNKVIDIVESAGKAYFSFNNDTYKVDVSTLKDENYLTKELINPNTEEKLEGCIRKTLDSEDVFTYTYGSCTPIDVPLSVELNGGTPSQEFKSIYDDGTKIELKEPIHSSASFTGWEILKGNSILKGNTLIIGTTETILYAKWQTNPTLKVDLDEGNDNVDYNENYKSGTIIELEVPIRENYKFVGWEVLEGNSVLSGNTLTIGTTNTVIKAKWELNVFNLSIDPNGGTLSKNYNGEYVVGTNIILETPVRTGYTFTGWTSTSGSVSGNTFTIVNSDAVLTANWKANTYMVTLDAHGGEFSLTQYTEAKEHIYMVPETAKYQLEVWGAQGGSASDIYHGGYGGYTVGVATLTSGTSLFVNVGGQGEAQIGNNLTAKGGYNGGGSALTTNYNNNYINSSGGGASHIATKSGELSSLSSNIDSILIIAGGGGGGNYWDNYYRGKGGSGGGYVGNNAIYVSFLDGSSNHIGTGGNQTSGGYCQSKPSKIVGIFGAAVTATYIYDSSSLAVGAGGGGGFYGGGGGCYAGQGGGGGSGYIGNPLLTNKAMYCYNCEESNEELTKTISITNVSETAISNYAKIGDGAAIIRKITMETIQTYNSNYVNLPTLSKDNYKFIGWNTKSDGSGTYISSNTIMSSAENHVLYAIWE